MRASLTDILTRTSARVGQVGEDHRARPARGKLNREVARHADFHARHGMPTSREDPRVEFGEDVRLGPM